MSILEVHELDRAMQIFKLLYRHSVVIAICIMLVLLLN